MTHRVKGFSVVNEADAFLEFFSFFYDATAVGNLISDFSVIVKSSLNMSKFLVQVEA